MRLSAEFETQMTAVERIIEYINLPAETRLHSAEAEKINRKWPENGKIVFRDLSLRYAEQSEYVLKNISLEINAAVS